MIYAIDPDDRSYDFYLAGILTVTPPSHRNPQSSIDSANNLSFLLPHYHSFEPLFDLGSLNWLLPLFSPLPKTLEFWLWNPNSGGHEKAPLHESQPRILVNDGHYGSVRRDYPYQSQSSVLRVEMNLRATVTTKMALSRVAGLGFFAKGLRSARQRYSICSGWKIDGEAAIM